MLQKDNLNPEEVKEPLKELMKELDSWNLFPFSNVHGSNEPKKRGLGGLPGQFGKTASLSGLGLVQTTPSNFLARRLRGIVWMQGYQIFRLSNGHFLIKNCHF